MNTQRSSKDVSVEKNEKTLLNFFKTQIKNEKIKCSSCGEDFLLSKINWHRDFDCEVIKKTSNKYDHLVKNKASCSRKRRKKKIVPKSYSSDSDVEILSDSECQTSLSNKQGKIDSPLFDLNEGHCDKENSEEMIADDGSLKDFKICKTTMKQLINSSSLQTKKDGTSMKVVCKNSHTNLKNLTENKSASQPVLNLEDGSCKLDINKTIKKESLLETLRNDWASPDSTPLKLNDKTPRSNTNISTTTTVKLENEDASFEINKNSDNPSLNSVTDIKSNGFRSNRVPKKEVRNNKALAINKNSSESDFSLISSDNSEDEFEKNCIEFNSPRQSGSLSQCKTNKELHNKIGKKRKNSNTLPMSPPSCSSIRDPNKGSHSIPLESHCKDISNSTYEETPCHSPALVTPERTPSPSPDRSRNKSLHNTISLSPSIRYTPQRFGLTNKLSSSTYSPKTCGHSSQKSNKKTPVKALKSLQKSTIQNDSSLSLANVCRELYTPTKLPNTSSSPSPNKFRNFKGMYLDNFLKVIDVVTSQPEDLELFNADDLKAIKNFHALTLPAQKLYFRLFQRKLKWNKVSKVEYKDICDKIDTSLYIDELDQFGFLLSEGSLVSLEDLIGLLDAKDIRNLCKDMKIPTTGSKETLVAKLIKFDRQQKSIKSSFRKAAAKESRIFCRAKECVGKSFLLKKDAWNMFMRILQLYSPSRFDEDEEGGQQPQLTALLLVGIGKRRFPSYKVSRKHTIYRSRDDLLRFQTFVQLHYETQEYIKNQQWECAINTIKQVEEMAVEFEKDEEIIHHEASLPSFLRRNTTNSLIHHMRDLAVEVYQRQKHYLKAVHQLEQLLAQKTYLQDYRGRWYDRLALNLHQHLKKPRESLDVIKEALEDDEVRVGHRLALTQRAERILNSKGTQKLAVKVGVEKFQLMTFQEAPKVVIQGKSIPSNIPGYKRVFLSQGANNDEKVLCSVEELVLDHYKKEGYPEGLHYEGRTIHALFGFFLWDILYLDIPDAFRSPHQAMPLDLNSPHFYMSRKREIDKRLRKIQKWSLTKANEEIQKIWLEQKDTISIIEWSMFSSVGFAQGLVAGLGMKLITAICRRLAEDHRFTRSGFPDLIVWNPEEKKSRIVEVKGPNDKLSTKQMLWLDFLLSNGATAEVCHVEAVGARRELKGSGTSTRNGTATNETPLVDDETISFESSSQGDGACTSEKKQKGVKRKRKT